MPNMPIYGTIATETVDKARLLLPQAVGRADGCEFRADYLKQNLSMASVHAIVLECLQHYPSSTIFTLRHKDQGGQIELSDAQRLGYYDRVVKLGVPIIDVELYYWSSIVPYLTLNGRGTRIIASHHNFTHTDPSDLSDTYERMKSLEPRPDIIKIVTMLHSSSDAETLARFAESVEGVHAVFGMARELGLKESVITSRVRPDNSFAYGSLDMQVAPGQPTVEELKARMRSGPGGI